MTCDFGTAAPPIGSCVNVNKGSVELMRWLQTMEHVAPVCVWGLHGPGPRKSCSEVGEAPAELAELFPRSITCLGSSCVRGARLCPGGTPVFAGEGVWGPREPACFRATPFPRSEAVSGVSPWSAGGKGLWLPPQGKPVDTDP